MAQRLRQIVRWPGLRSSVISLNYTLTQGITPGRIEIVANWQPQPPSAIGTLIFGDGVRTIALPNCQMVDFRESVTTQGRVSIITLEDERWTWRFGSIRRVYNQLDPNNKLTAWTIKSATEIAQELLQAMGVTNYKLRLPQGLSSSVGRNLNEFLKRGDNFPQTFANPPVNWDSIPPAVCLNDLANRYGCRICYQPMTRSVSVIPYGGAIFNGYKQAQLRNVTRGIRIPSIPKNVVVLGAEASYQCQLRLEPMAEEWDGSYVPYKQASYAPLLDGQVQITESTSQQPTGASHVFTLFDDKNEFITELSASSVAALITAINADSRAKEWGIATAAGSDGITFTGVKKKSFGVKTRLSGGDNDRGFSTKLVQPFSSGQPGWDLSFPPTFAGVRPVAGRLTIDEAIERARRSVWKAFRVIPINPSDTTFEKYLALNSLKARDAFLKKNKLIIPGFGQITRRQQIIMTDRKVNRLKPQPRDDRGQVTTNQSIGIPPDYYTGANEAEPAMVYGTYANGIGGISWTNSSEANPNSPKDARVHIGFRILPEHQIILFSDYVYRWTQAGPSIIVSDPGLIYEGAVHVREAGSNAIVRSSQSLSLPYGFAPDEFEIRDDVVISAIGEYDDKHVLKKTKKDVLGDSAIRAQYYLQGMTRKYVIPYSAVYTYGGIVPVPVDESVLQVSWSISTEAPGPTTVIGVNTEVSPLVVPYPQMQLRENLNPSVKATIQTWADAYGGLAGVKATAIAVGRAVAPKLVAALGG